MIVLYKTPLMGWTLDLADSNLPFPFWGRLCLQMSLECRIRQEAQEARLCTKSQTVSNSPPWLRRGAAKRRGGSFKEINLLNNTTPALRATPPQLRRGVLRVYPTFCAKRVYLLIGFVDIHSKKHKPRSPPTRTRWHPDGTQHPKIKKAAIASGLIY